MRIGSAKTSSKDESKMASIHNNHELTVILTEEAGFEGNLELLEQSSKQLESECVDSPPDVSAGSRLTTTSNSASMLALSPVHNLESDNAARSRSPVQHWQYSTINLHNVSWNIINVAISFSYCM